MLALIYAIVLGALEAIKIGSLKLSSSSSSTIATMQFDMAHILVTDVTVSFCSPSDVPSACALDPMRWHRIEKELYLHSAQQSAWLHFAQAKERQLTVNDLVITDIAISRLRPKSSSEQEWESRPGGIWVQRHNYTGSCQHAVTGIDVLFGSDAVDPRPQWNLIQMPLQLKVRVEAPIAKLSVRYGMPKPRHDGYQSSLKVREDSTFKIVQISDTHMVTGVGKCTDAIDANGQNLPESEADPLTVRFIGEILDVEKPDLVILTGDQLHHDILDSQTSLFKVVTPMVDRCIPYAAVFGNHDAEGAYALSRKSSYFV